MQWPRSRALGSAARWTSDTRAIQPALGRGIGSAFAVGRATSAAPVTARPVRNRRRLGNKSIGIGDDDSRGSGLLKMCRERRDDESYPAAVRDYQQKIIRT